MAQRYVGAVAVSHETAHTSRGDLQQAPVHGDEPPEDVGTATARPGSWLRGAALPVPHDLARARVERHLGAGDAGAALPDEQHRLAVGEGLEHRRRAEVPAVPGLAVDRAVPQPALLAR